jgi:hypothetical protein
LSRRRPLKQVNHSRQLAARSGRTPVRVVVGDVRIGCFVCVTMRLQLRRFSWRDRLFASIGNDNGFNPAAVSLSA